MTLVEEIKAAMDSKVTVMFLTGLVALAQRNPEAVFAAILEAGEKLYREQERMSNGGH
jgi:hypothetical protein